MKKLFMLKYFLTLVKYQMYQIINNIHRICFIYQKVFGIYKVPMRYYFIENNQNKIETKQYKQYKNDGEYFD